MRKTLLALGVAASVTFSTIVPAAAQTTELEPENTAETSLSAELSSESESTESEDSETQLFSSLSSGGSSEGEAGELIGGAVVLAAVVGLAGAGVTWAVQQRLIPNPLPGIIPGPAPKSAPAPAPAPKPSTQVYYQNCAAVWNAIGGPIRKNDPGYRSAHDRDGDGVGCERDPR